MIQSAVVMDVALFEQAGIALAPAVADRAAGPTRL